jgi:SAM-dependent methyltransferase
MHNEKRDTNLDQEVIDSFGREWNVFDYLEPNTSDALDKEFAAYCTPISLKTFNPSKSVVADFGAGSGRWTSRLIEHFSLVYALEPSHLAVEVLKQKFDKEKRVVILHESIGLNSIPNESLDLGMCLGVLHHIPNTALAIKDISKKIRSGGTFHAYLYYKLDHKPLHYRTLFLISTPLRWFISRMPHSIRRSISQVIALVVYWPLARTAKLLAARGKDISNFPLHHYANKPFVMLANDALDRFGTSLEKRFSKAEITEMLRLANFDVSTLVFSDVEPFWTFAVEKL